MQPIKSVFVEPSFVSIRSSFLLGIEMLSSSGTFGLTLNHASHTHLYIFSFKHGSWLPILLFVIFQAFSMELISGKFPCYLRTCTSLHLKHGLVLFELWCKVMHKDISLLWEHNTFTLVCISVITIDAIVVFGANRMRNIMLSVFMLW